EAGALLSFERQYRKFSEHDATHLLRGKLMKFRLEDEMLSRSSPADKIFWYQLGHDKKIQRFRWQFSLHCTVPECCQVTVDGAARRAFRCYRFLPARGIEPVSWKATILGLPDDTKSYPVFIQSHAVEQWTKRLPKAFVHYQFFSD